MKLLCFFADEKHKISIALSRTPHGLGGFQVVYPQVDGRTNENIGAGNSKLTRKIPKAQAHTTVYYFSFLTIRLDFFVGTGSLFICCHMPRRSDSDPPVIARSAHRAERKRIGSNSIRHAARLCNNYASLPLVLRTVVLLLRSIWKSAGS